MLSYRDLTTLTGTKHHKGNELPCSGPCRMFESLLVLLNCVCWTLFAPTRLESKMGIWLTKHVPIVIQKIRINADRKPAVNKVTKVINNWQSMQSFPLCYFKSKNVAEGHILLINCIKICYKGSDSKICDNNQLTQAHFDIFNRSSHVANIRSLSRFFNSRQ